MSLKKYSTNWAQNFVNYQGDYEEDFQELTGLLRWLIRLVEILT